MTEDEVREICREEMRRETTPNAHLRGYVPVRISQPRYGLYETVEGYRIRLEEAATLEGFAVVPRAELDALNAVVDVCGIFVERAPYHGVYNKVHAALDALREVRERSKL
jgi:hypothetical protein